MTNQSTIDMGPMEGVAEGVVPTPATEALRIFMAQHVHDQTIGANATATCTAASHCQNLCVNGATEQSCHRRQLQHPPALAPPLPTSEPLDMSDLTRATARVERRALRKKRSASTASHDENADDEFPAIEWNSDDDDDDDDDDDEDDSEEDIYAINDNEPSRQEQEDNENLQGTAVSSGVEVEGILKDDGEHSGKAIAEESHQASPTKKPLRKRRSGDALGMEACAETLQRAKSRKMCLPGLGQKDTDPTNEECGCLMATPSRPTSSTNRPKNSLLADSYSFMGTAVIQTSRQTCLSSSPLQTASIPSSITSKSPSSIAQKPATAAFLAATLERVATSEDFTNLSPLPPSRVTSWGQFVSADNISPLPSPSSHYYNSSLIKHKSSSTSRSNTGLALKKAGSYGNVIAFQRGGKGLSSGAGSKRNNSFCPNYKRNKTTTTTRMAVSSPWSSPPNTTTSSF